MIWAEKEGLRSKNNCKIAKSQIEKILKTPFYYGHMRYNELLYKYIHPTLISKELFYECQAVKQGRRRTKSKRIQKSFVLKGMQIPTNILVEIDEELKKSLNKEHQH